MRFLLSSPYGKVFVSNTPESFPEEAARHLQHLIADCTAIALSGGSTPAPVYEQLGKLLSENQGGKVHSWFQIDERMVMPTHLDSNQRLIKAALFGKDQPNHIRFFAVPIVEGPPEVISRHYAQILAENLPIGPHGLPAFDLAILGIGDDGHTASLFPDTSWLVEDDELFKSVWVSSQKSFRLTVPFHMLQQAKNLVFLASGERKAGIMQRILSGHGDELPAAVVARSSETVDWLLDPAAAKNISI